MAMFESHRDAPPYLCGSPPRKINSENTEGTTSGLCSEPWHYYAEISSKSSKVSLHAQDSLEPGQGRRSDKLRALCG